MFVTILRYLRRQTPSPRCPTSPLTESALVFAATEIPEKFTRIKTDMYAAAPIVYCPGVLHLPEHPCFQLVKTALMFMSEITLSSNAGGPWVDAKNIVAVTMLKHPTGQALHIRATGDDAEKAVDELVKIINELPSSHLRFLS
jgi:phosphocarrier protein